MNCAPAKRLKVLFVCIGNSCRSQIAEALARHLASDTIDAASAGVSPMGRIMEQTRKVLLERGIRLDGQYSKGFSEARPEDADVVINMSGMRGSGLFPNHPNVLDWDVPDPFGEELGIYRDICDEIEQRLRDWLAGLNRQSTARA